MRLITLPSILVLATAVIYSPAQAQTYITFTFPGAVNGTVAEAINDNGQITGWWADVQTRHGFLRAADGVMTSFDPPGSTYTVPLSINASGMIVGYYYDADDLGHGFVRDAAGSFESFEPGGATYIASAAINAAGQVAGSTEYSAFEREPDGTITTFQIHTDATSANAINDQGFIVGQAGTVSFVRDPAGRISVGNPVPGYFVAPRAINNKGTVAGFLAGGYNVGFTRPLHGPSQFFGINGSFHTWVTGIDGSDNVVGYYENYIARGFLRAENGTVTLIDCPGYAETQPYGINTTGTVVGSADPGVDLISFVGFTFTP